MNNLKGCLGGLLYLDFYIEKLWNKLCLIEFFVYVIYCFVGGFDFGWWKYNV